MSDPALADQLRERGASNAARFSWQRSAAALAAVLAGVLSPEA